MALEHAILGFLDREPMTGYDLKTRCLDTTAGHVWKADQAQVYRTLDRLRAAGLVRSKLVAQRGKPDRRLYSITDRGRAELDHWVRNPEDPPAPRDPFLLQLMFSADLDDDELVGLLSHARDVYQTRLERLRRSAPPPREPAPTRRDELQRMTLAAGTSSARCAIDWIDDCLEKVGSGLPEDGNAGPDGETGDGERRRRRSGRRGKGVAE